MDIIKTLKPYLPTISLALTVCMPILYQIYIMDKINDFEYSVLNFKQRYQLAFSLIILIIVEIVLITIFNFYYFHKQLWRFMVLEAMVVIIFIIILALSNMYRREIHITINIPESGETEEYIVIHQTLDGMILLNNVIDTDKYRFISKEELYKHVLTVKKRKNRNKD